MDKQHRPVGLLALAVLALPLSAGCGGSLPPDQALARATPDVARVDVVEGRDCGTSPSVAKMPDHCALSTKTGRTSLLTADVQFVASVDTEGRPSSVKILKAPDGFGLEEAVVHCAMQGSYSLPVGAQGGGAETCPVTLRLRRYASDPGRADPTPLPCPVVRPYNVSVWGVGGVVGEAAGTDCVSR